MCHPLLLIVAPIALVCAVQAGESEPAVTAPDEVRRVPMLMETARDLTFAWSASKAGEDKPAEAVVQLWENVDPGVDARELHLLTVRSFAASDPAIAALVVAVESSETSTASPDVAELTSASNDEFFRVNLSLHAARAMTDRRLYDEALELYATVDLKLAVDPASALFYQAVCQHQLLRRDEGLQTTAALLNSTDGVPESYLAVARLMRAELETLEPETLDEIAGLMRDVERRLALARGGQRVQKKEDEIASKLDEMIKKIEQQMSQSSSSSGSGNSGNQNQSSNPLGDSVVKGATAPGEVDPKQVRPEGGWGGLAPREREQAKNEIERAFPSNYGRLINEYFLKRTRTDRPADE